MAHLGDDPTVGEDDRRRRGPNPVVSAGTANVVGAGRARPPTPPRAGRPIAAHRSHAAAADRRPGFASRTPYPRTVSSDLLQFGDHRWRSTQCRGCRASGPAQRRHEQHGPRRIAPAQHPRERRRLKIARGSGIRTAVTGDHGISADVALDPYTLEAQGNRSWHREAHSCAVTLRSLVKTRDLIRSGRAGLDLSQ